MACGRRLGRLVAAQVVLTPQRRARALFRRPGRIALRLRGFVRDPAGDVRTLAGRFSARALRARG